MKMENWTKEPPGRGARTPVELNTIVQSWSHEEKDRAFVTVKDRTYDENTADENGEIPPEMAQYEVVIHWDGQRDFLFEDDNKEVAMRYARCWMRRHPNIIEHDEWAEKNSARLSEEGMRILDETGYVEVYVPYTYQGEDAGGTPFQMTVDFVADDVPEVDGDADEREYQDQTRHRQDWASRNLFRLIREGKVLSISGERGDPVNSVCEAWAYKDRITKVI